MTKAQDKTPVRLLRNRRGVSIIEFSLGLPILLGFSLCGIEMANYILANIAVQRIANEMADMVGQTGVGDVATTEAQIYDMFASTDARVTPVDIPHYGRVIVSVIRGVTQSNGTVRNEYADPTYSQQFHGGYTTAVPLIGCKTTTPLPVFSRILPANEILVHTQVSYLYQPIFSQKILTYFTLPVSFTRTATARIRKNRFQITNDGSHPAKSKCNTVNGL